MGQSGLPTQSRGRHIMDRHLYEDLMDWRHRIAADPNVLVGKPTIKGTRISVELIMELLAGGYTPDQIQQQYDHVTLEDIHACLAYAREVLRSERMFALKS